MDFTRVSENLKARGYAVSCFATAREAADYLDRTIDGRTVGFGGSATLTAMGLVLSAWAPTTASCGTGTPGTPRSRSCGSASTPTYTSPPSTA